jgi:hypothetical protein
MYEPRLYQGRVWKPGNRSDSEGFVDCPHGKPGDKLWVKETFAIPYKLERGKIAPKEDIIYRVNPRDVSSPVIWKPSIFMRREYSRISLEITSVRVERLQDISEAGANAEGVNSLAEYQELWESIHRHDIRNRWHNNPLVWVIEFKRI